MAQPHDYFLRLSKLYNRRVPCPNKPGLAVCSEVKLLKYNRRVTYYIFALVDCTVGVASPGEARQAQISCFLLVLGPEEVLAEVESLNVPMH